MARGVHVRVRRTTFQLITIWSGSVATIPAGLHLCTALEGYFVKGVGPTEVALATGGSDTASLAHDHVFPSPGLDEFVTDDEATHGHGGTLFTTGTNAVASGLLGTPASRGAAHAHGIAVTSTRTVAHHHAFDGATAATDQTFDNRPPWYALAYIKGPQEIPPGSIAMYDGPPSTLGTRAAGPTTALADPLGASTAGSFDSVDVTAPLGIATPFRAYVGGECLGVLDTGGDDTSWTVVRGLDGSPTPAHAPGSAVTLPKYAICDGRNGTPGLADRFVAGAGGTWTIGQSFGLSGPQGGPNHSHGIAGAVGLAPHSHDFVGSLAVGGGQDSGSALGPAISAPHGHGFDTFATPGSAPTADGDHPHGLTHFVGTPGPTYDGLFDPTPRFVSVYYVMRVPYA